MRLPPAPRAISALFVTALVGCAENYLYVPQAANASENGIPARRTAIPPQAPEGSVELSSYGITDLGSDGDEQVPALVVRMIVDNRTGAKAWTVDTRAERVRIDGEGESRPMYVNTDLGTPPVLDVPPGQHGVLDFYFPLPDTVEDAGDLPGFEFAWQVATASARAPGLVEFDRVAVEPPPAYVETYPHVWVVGYGPYWWYDPFYPHVVFIHARPIGVQPYRPGFVGVRHPGHYRYVPARPGYAPRGGGFRHAPAGGGRPHR